MIDGVRTVAQIYAEQKRRGISKPEQQRPKRSVPPVPNKNNPFKWGYRDLGAIQSFILRDRSLARRACFEAGEDPDFWIGPMTADEYSREYQKAQAEGRPVPAPRRGVLR